MTKKDDQSLATKQDFTLLMDRINGLYEDNKKWRQEMHDGFALMTENIRYDITGAQNDRFVTIENDVTRLKQHTGLVA